LQVCALVVHGVLWFSPQCSTWLGFLSKHSCGRDVSNCFIGNDSSQKVREGTITAMVGIHYNV